MNQMNQKTNEATVFQIEVGRTYELQDGSTVLIIGRAKNLRGYETVYDEHGHHRYDRSTHDSDTGRCTGTAHDYSHPRNLKRPIVPVDVKPDIPESTILAEAIGDFCEEQKKRIADLERLTAGFERLVRRQSDQLSDQHMKLYSAERDLEELLESRADLERQLAEAREELSHLKSHTVHVEKFFEAERLLREAREQLDRLVGAVERVIPYLPEVEPIGAAAHSEHNRASWDLRQMMKSFKRMEVRSE